MRILYLAMDSVNYEAQSHEILVAEEIAKMGHEITLVCERTPFGYEKSVPYNIKFHVMPINNELSEEQYSLLIQEEYDIAFASSFPGVKHINRLGREKGVKTIGQVLDVPIFRLHYKAWYDLWQDNIKELKNCDVIIGNIEVTKQLLSNLSRGELQPKIRTVYYGIATDNADAIPEQPKEDYICWVSRICWWKGIELLLFALACIPPNKRPMLKIVGVGDKTEWEEQNIPFRIIQIANHLAVKCEFVGGVGDNDKFKIIKASKLAVMCDYSQSIATMFCLESTYCGVPCITGSLPVCKDRYEDSVIYVDKIYDTGEWARKIEEVWSNIDSYTQFAKSKKQWVIENRSFKSQSKELIKIFEEVKG